MKNYHRVIYQDDDITITEDTREKLDSERKGRYWLWDKHLKQNLAMGAVTKDAALIQALNYHRKQAIEYKSKYNDIKSKVDCFVSQFISTEDECN